MTSTPIDLTQIAPNSAIPQITLAPGQVLEIRIITPGSPDVVDETQLDSGGVSFINPPTAINPMTVNASILTRPEGVQTIYEILLARQQASAAAAAAAAALASTPPPTTSDTTPP